LRDWADILVLAPLSAHTLAKIAHGLCDDTLSCVARAWDFGHYDSSSCGSDGGKPVVLAPAMNTAMWEHPLTHRQLATIQSFWKSSDKNCCGVHVVPPQSKLLACGELGMGALASVDAIVQAVRDAAIPHNIGKRPNDVRERVA
jgi:phosphopantothenoylcysteine synthetase/decarboxylase